MPCNHPVDDGTYIIYHRPQGCLPIQRRPYCLHASNKGYADNEDYVEPVDMLVPVGFGDGLVGDVRLLWVVASASIWF